MSHLHSSAQESEPEIVVTDLEFMFLGGVKPLMHTIQETDFFEDRGDHFFIRWNDVGEEALIYKAQILQFGRRVRLVKRVDPNNAVQKVVKEIKEKAAAAQGAVGKSQTQVPAFEAAERQLARAAISPADLWDRSPIRQ